MAKRPLWRRIVRVVGIAIGVLVVLAVLALGALHTRWGKAWVRGKVEARLAQKFAGGATLGSLDYGFLFSSIELGDLVIRDAAGTPAIRIGSLHAEVDRGSLLERTPVIDALAVEGLDVTVTQAADGRSNLVGLMVPGGPSTLASIAVRSLSVKGHATLTGSDGTVVTVTDLSMTGSLTAHPVSQELQVALGPITAQLTMEHAGAPKRALALAVTSTSLARAGTATDLDVRGVTIGAVSVASIGGRVDIENGRLIGAQRLAAEGIRIDHQKLATMLGRVLLVDDVRADVTLAGPVEALVVHGAAAVRTTSLAVDGTIDLSNRLSPRYKLALAGKGKSEDIIAVASPSRAVSTDIKITIDGQGVALANLESAMTLEMGATTIGAVTLEGVSGKLRATKGAVILDQLTARGLGFELGATGELAADTTVHARLTADGDPSKALSELAASGIAGPRRLPALPHVSLAVSAAGTLEGKLDVVLEPAQVALAGGYVAVSGGATLDHRKLVDAHADVRLRGLDLARLSRLAGKPPKLRGQLDGRLALHRTPGRDVATYDVVATLPQVAVHAHGHADRAGLTATAQLTHRGAGLGTVTATVPLAQGKLARTRPWHITLDVPRTTLVALGDLLPPNVRDSLAANPDAAVEVRADIAGTPAAPRGTVDIGMAGTPSVTLHAEIAPAKGGTVITTKGDVGGDIASSLRGTITIPASDVQRAIVDETITIAERPLATLPRVPPAVAALGGTVGGRIHIAGTVGAPTVEGTFSWREYRMAAGGTGETTLVIAGTPTKLSATLDHAHGGITIVADVARTPDRIDITAHAQARDTPLRALLPALAAVERTPSGADLGSLRWDMRADLGLVRRQGHLVLDRAAVDGTLAIHGGSFAIPHSTRSWHDIELEIAGDPQGVRLTTLDVHESDRQLADRRIHASGLLTVDRLTPTHVALALEMRDWLLIGLTSPVFTDAPTAAVDLAARVEGNLTAPVPDIDVTIDALDLKSPDRHLRAHQPERASLGDVIFVDGTAPVGRLPVIPPVGPIPGGRPLDLHVHIPKPVRVNKDPLDIMVTGDLDVAVRRDKTVPAGVVTLRSGWINLFAHQHPLVRGTITLSEAHPRGWLALEFENRLPDPTARDLAHPERGVHLTLTGDPAVPRLAVSGGANAALPDVLTMYNAGHPLHTASPGLPASSTARVPRGDQANVLAFVSLALPHLLFLDRVAAWSDATEPRGAYGRIRNLEADRYTQHERNRVRAVGRPTAPGRSTAEVQLDHLLLHDDRKALGVGVRAGDRLGGGVGLIFEWSSRP